MLCEKRTRFFARDGKRLFNSYQSCGILNPQYYGRNYLCNGAERLNVTTRGRYALRVMLDLAQHPDEGYISLKTVAERQDISMKYLESIVCALKKAGLVESSRGKEGGYALLRAPEDYSVGEILRCTEDKLAPVSCITAGGVSCTQASLCLTLPMWRELDELTNAYLDGVTLGDLLSGEKWKHKKPVQIQKGT